MQIPSNGMRQFPTLAFLSSLLQLQLQLPLLLLFCLLGASLSPQPAITRTCGVFSRSNILHPTCSLSFLLPPTDTLVLYTHLDLLPSLESNLNTPPQPTFSQTFSKLLGLVSSAFLVLFTTPPRQHYRHPKLNNPRRRTVLKSPKA